MDSDAKSSRSDSLDASFETGANSSAAVDFAQKIASEKVRILLKSNDALKQQVLKIQRECKVNIPSFVSSPSSWF